MTSDQGALGGSYRVIRAVRARDDGPWPGALVRTESGESFVLVGADVVGADWFGWDAAPDGHVLAPVDVARRADGHAAVLPVCAERLEEFIRRRAARMPFSAGEAVTLGVSVLRGCAEIASLPDTTGEWWLDEAGRPVLATDTAPGRAREAAASLLESVAVDARLQRAWAAALRAIVAERVSVHELEAAEEALFAVARAEPLSRVSLGPRSAADGVARLQAQERRADDDARSAYEPAPRSLWHGLIAGVDDDLSDAVSRATTAVWRRLRQGEGPKRARSRRAPWLVGGAVAAAVLTGGALWPTASGGASDEPAPAATPQISASPTTPPSADPAGPAAAGDGGGKDAAAPADLAAIAAALLTERSSCGDDETCLASIMVSPQTRFAGAVELSASDRTVTLLDDFGDLAVVRVDARDGAQPSQLVFIRRTNEEWLLRDVTDVAQQP